MNKIPVLLFTLLLYPLSTVSAQDVHIIGASLSLTAGNTEQSGMMYDGYRLWADELNKAGGLLGIPVELRIYDDEGLPEKVKENYRRLIEQDGAELLLAPYGTPLTIVASDAAEEAGIPMIASGAAGREIWSRGNRYIFGMYALAERFPIGFLDICAREGLESVGIVYENSPFHRDVYRGTVEWAKKFGLELRVAVAVDSVHPELAMALENLKAAMPDAVFVSLYNEAGYRFIDMMKRTSFRARATAFTILPLHPDFYKNAGMFAEGIFGPSQWEPKEKIPYPGTREFIRLFKDRYGIEPSYHAGSAYASCQILTEGIESIGSIDYEKLRDYIHFLDTVTVIGRFKVDAAGMQIGHNPILIQWQDGKKEVVYPSAMQTSAPRFR